MVGGVQQHAITDALSARRERVPDGMDCLAPLVYAESAHIAHRHDVA